MGVTDGETTGCETIVIFAGCCTTGEFPAPVLLTNCGELNGINSLNLGDM